MNDQERRMALADFLRSQRARLSPTEVGILGGARRRTPGLRREEVAQLANVGLSWYVSLEQGRDVHPSVQVLENLAQALRLNLAERRHLFLLAEQRIPSTPTSLAETVSPALRQTIQSLDPNPAFVLGKRWDYLTWNKAAELLFSISRRDPPYERNLVWWLFSNLDRWKHLSDWREYAQGVLAEFRVDCARHQGDPWIEALIEDLKQASPEFRKWWPRHNVRNYLEEQKIFENDRLGHLEFDHITLLVPSNPDLKVMIYAASPETAQKLSEALTKTAESSIPGGN